MRPWKVKTNRYRPSNKRSGGIIRTLIDKPRKTMKPQIMNLDTSRLAPKTTDNGGPEAEKAEKPSAPAEPLNWEQIEDLKKAIIAALCTCFDPEIPVNIYELGLIYDLQVDDSGSVQV